MNSEAHAESNQSSCTGLNSTGPCLSERKTSENVQISEQSKDMPKIYSPQTDYHQSGSSVTVTEANIDVDTASEMGKLILGDLQSDLASWLDTFLPKHGIDGHRQFNTAISSPPLSVHSLQELELGSMCSNPKLRHDINFDRVLHFTPNGSGPGSCTTKQAKDYWVALETELELYDFLIHDPKGHEYRQTSIWIVEFNRNQKRIPKAFEVLKELVLFLMPERDHAGVEYAFDLPFIMQQIQRGIFDITPLAVWLAKLFKSHCAPIRDAWIDSMVLQLSSPAKDSAHGMVQGMKELFGILEAMKLDIANHQIRSLRIPLMIHTTTFERMMARKRLADGVVKKKEALDWYHQTTYDSIVAQAKSPPLFRFICCLVGSLLPVPTSKPPMPPLPLTFSMDFDRLFDLHKAISATVNEEVCILRLRAMLYKLQRSRQDIDLVTAELRELLPTLVDHTSKRNEWQHAVPNVAAELARLANKPSRLQPLTSKTSVIPDQPAISPAKTEEQLRRDLTIGGELHHNQTQALGVKMLKIINALAERYTDARTLDLFQAFVGPLSDPDDDDSTFSLGPSDAAVPLHPNAKFPNICIRLTHIILLQWRAWGPLVYAPEMFEPPEAGSEAEEESASDETSDVDAGDSSEESTAEAVHEGPTSKSGKVVAESSRDTPPQALKVGVAEGADEEKEEGKEA